MYICMSIPICIYIHIYVEAEERSAAKAAAEDNLVAEREEWRLARAAARIEAVYI